LKPVLQQERSPLKKAQSELRSILIKHYASLSNI